MSNPAQHDKEGYVSLRRDVHKELLRRSDRLQTIESQIESEDEVAWLIEHPRENDAPEWWDGSAWTTDHLHAVRFARKQDAERVVAKNEINFLTAFGSGVSATEHMWVGSASPPGEPTQEGR